MKIRTFFTKNLLIILPCLLLFFLALTAITFGTKFISPISIFLNKCSSVDLLIIKNIRIPRILLSILCGALLGGTGAIFQGFFRNPLADPGIMGISSGASFGAILSGLFSFTSFTFISPLSIFAFFGAILSALCVFLFSKIFNKASSSTLLLSGTAVGTFFSAISSILLLTHENDLHSFYVWTTGSFNAKGWSDFYLLIIPSIISLVLLQLSAKHLDVLICGEDSAKLLGLDYSKIRNYVLLSGSLAASCAVCAGGIISFIGLISPHIVRKIYGPRHKILIFESMIFGAILMLVADTISRTIIRPSELPVGIITSLIGVPCFIITLIKMNGDK